MMAVQSQTVCALALVALLPISFAFPSSRHRQDVRPVCEGCGDDCDKCEFGVTISALCAIPECRRGPGQSCGGPNGLWGVCGDGLTCNCNRCSGCSLESLTCYPNACMPMHNQLVTRYADVYSGTPVAE